MKGKYLHMPTGQVCTVEYVDDGWAKVNGLEFGVVRVESLEPWTPAPKVIRVATRPKPTGVWKCLDAIPDVHALVMKGMSVYKASIEIAEKTGIKAVTIADAYYRLRSSGKLEAIETCKGGRPSTAAPHMARVEQLVNEGTPITDAFAMVSEESGVAEATLHCHWYRRYKKRKAS